MKIDGLNFEKKYGKRKLGILKPYDTSRGRGARGAEDIPVILVGAKTL